MRWLVSAALGVGCFTGLARPEDTATTEITLSPSSRDVLLRAPFPALRASFFHAALDVPPLQPARTLEPGELFLQLETSHARSVDRRRIDGVENHFDGLFHEWGALRLVAGVLPRVDVEGRLALSGWDEQLDRFTLLDAGGNPIVENEDRVVLGTGASKRHDNVSHVILRARGLILRHEETRVDLAFQPSVKIPVARAKDLTNAGTTDLGFTLLASVPIGPVTVHGNLGVGLPLGKQNLFVGEADVDLNPFIHGGLAATWVVASGLALIGQLETSSSAFRDVEFLEEPLLTIFGGLRKSFGRLFIEAGGGTGLLPRSSYDYAFQLSVGYLLGE